MYEFGTHIGGVECLCQVVHYTPPEPIRVGREWGDATPPIEMEFEYQLISLEGLRLYELETDENEKLLIRRFLDHKQNAAYLDHTEYSKNEQRTPRNCRAVRARNSPV